MNLRKNLESRWAKDWDAISRFGSAKIALTRALDLNDKVREAHSSIMADRDLSALGKSNKVRDFLAKEAAPELRRAQKATETMRAGIKAWRERLQPPKPDPSDTAGAILRAQMRDFLRGLKGNGERAALLISDNPDPVMVAAVLEAPSALSGVPDDVRRVITEAAIERAHPGQLAAIDQANDVAEIVWAATQIATDAARNAGEFPNDVAFQSFLAGSAGQAAAQVDAEVASRFREFAPMPQAA